MVLATARQRSTYLIIGDYLKGFGMMVQLLMLMHLQGLIGGTELQVTQLVQFKVMLFGTSQVELIV